jgi:hypothetical protein
MALLRYFTVRLLAETMVTVFPEFSISLIFPLHLTLLSINELLLKTPILLPRLSDYREIEWRKEQFGREAEHLFLEVHKRRRGRPATLYSPRCFRRPWYSTLV